MSAKHPSSPYPNEPIGAGQILAFSHGTFDDMPNLFLLDDTNGIRTIGQSDFYDVAPVWSPDGSQLIYTSSYGWSSRYFLVDADGSNHHQLGEDDQFKTTPRWSFDGTRLAYLAKESSDQAGPGEFSLNVMDLATGNAQRLSTSGIEDFAWLPDSNKLLTIMRDNGSVSFIELSTDGSQSQISQGIYLRDAVSISISPSTRQVAFTIPDDQPPKFTTPLFTANLDGSNKQHVGRVYMDGTFVWSPDSTKIAFISLENSVRTLSIANSDGTNAQNLLPLDQGDLSGEIPPSSPVWSPDSTQLAISSFLPEGSAVFVVKVNGGDQRQITMANGLIYDMAWKSDP